MSSARIVPVNYFDSAHSSISMSPAAPTNYPVTNLQSNVSNDVLITASDAEHTITGTFNGGARQISHFSVWPAPPDCIIGMGVHLVMWSDVAMTTVVFDQTYNPVFTPSGAVWNTFLWAIQNWGVDNADRTARLAPLVKWFTPVAVSAYSITFFRTGALETHYFAARRIWLGDYVAAPVNAGVGAAPQWVSSSSLRRTKGGTLRRIAGARTRAMRFDTIFEDEADRAAWMNLLYVADPANEIILSLFQEDTQRDRDTTVMGSLEVLNPIVFENPNFHRLQLAIVES